MERALKKIFGKKIEVIGSGRTDAKVHALGQTANFLTQTLLSAEKIRKALNFYLPAEIRVHSVEKADISFHSRYGAKRKTYRYLVISRTSPFLSDLAFYHPGKLDMERMRQGADYLTGSHDFSSFQNKGSGAKNTFLRIEKISFKRMKMNPGGITALAIDITAPFFLYKMVRNLAGLLLKIGEGDLEPRQAYEILKKKNRIATPPPAPPHGLYLLKVEY